MAKFTILSVVAKMISREAINIIDNRTHEYYTGVVNGVSVEDGSGNNFLVEVCCNGLGTREFFVRDGEGQFWMTHAHVKASN